MGILLALPITATLGVITRIILDWYVGTPFYQQKLAPKARSKAARQSQ
jgi:hypothetical protein